MELNLKPIFKNNLKATVTVAYLEQTVMSNLLPLRPENTRRSTSKVNAG